MAAWHWDRLRCRISQALYRTSRRLSGVADLIDPPGDHPRLTLTVTVNNRTTFTSTVPPRYGTDS